VTVVIRLAVSSDAAALARLHAASFEDGWSEEDFVTWLARKEAFAVLATHELEAVAFGLALAAGDDAELFAIATQPDQRRAGLGDRVFHALDVEAQRRGLGRWVLEVARNNFPALALYKSEGFVEIGVRNAYYRQGRGRMDAIVLSRPVGGQPGA
jgi:[ribosomal protein S18]-alanine N-acetyltransferase